MIDVERADPATLSVGDGVAVTVTDHLDRTDIVRYAGASGDFNPLHVDETRARAAGNDSVFAHGMLLCGYVSQVVSGWVGLAQVADLRTRFVARAEPGTSVVVRCEVVERTSEAGTAALDLAVEGDDETLVEGEATVTWRR